MSETQKGGPSFTEADVANDVKKKQPKKGAYHLLVTSASKKVNDNGNYGIKLNLAAVDANGQSVNLRGCSMTLAGPFKLDPVDAETYKVPVEAQKKIPNTAFLIRSYAQERQNDLHPFPIDKLAPIKRINGEWVAVDENGNPSGEPIESKEAREAKDKEIATQARQFYIWAWDDPNQLVGDRFVGEIGYDVSGKPGAYEGPQVKVLQGDALQKALFVDMTTDIFE